jgi:hypothetical protein
MTTVNLPISTTTQADTQPQVTLRNPKGSLCRNRTVVSSNAPCSSSPIPGFRLGSRKQDRFARQLQNSPSSPNRPFRYRTQHLIGIHCTLHAPTVHSLEARCSNSTDCRASALDGDMGASMIHRVSGDMTARRRGID